MNTILDIEEQIAHVRINVPERGNALSDSVVSELTGVLQEADQNPLIKSILLSAAGRNFCAGGDLNDFIQAQQKPWEEGYRDIESSMALFKLGFEIRTPIVVAVQGATRGGGLGLIAMAHLAVAHPQATFALPELGLGLFPFGIFPLLARAMGPRRSLELALTGRTFGADEALACGLIHETAPDPLKRCQELSQFLASRSALALTTGLEAYNHLTDIEDGSFGYLGLLRLLTFKSELVSQEAKKFLASRPHPDRGGIR